MPSRPEDEVTMAASMGPTRAVASDPPSRPSFRSATPSNWTLAALIALALFGYYASRGGRPLFGAVLRD